MNRPQADKYQYLAGLSHQTLLKVLLQQAVGDQMSHYYQPIHQLKQEVHTKGYMQTLIQ